MKEDRTDEGMERHMKEDREDEGCKGKRGMTRYTVGKARHMRELYVPRTGVLSHEFCAG